MLVSCDDVGSLLLGLHSQARTFEVGLVTKSTYGEFVEDYFVFCSLWFTLPNQGIKWINHALLGLYYILYVTVDVLLLLCALILPVVVITR